MTGINPAAAAAREAARSANGEFGEQHHSAPAAPLSQAIDQVRYEAPLKLAGFVPEDIDSTLARGFSWAHHRGNDLESLQEVRRAAGAMSDEDFKRLYERYNEFTRGEDSYSTFDWESWEHETKAAYRRGCGEVSEDYLADAGTSSEGYMGGHAFEGHLAKYAQEEGLTQTEVAKRIRRDVKAAQEAGYLPKSVKVSVRQQTGAMMSGFYVRATVPDEIYDPEPYPWDGPDPVSPWRARRNDLASELSRRLNVVTNRYGSSDTNSMVDYFDSYRESSVSLQPESWS